MIDEVMWSHLKENLPLGTRVKGAVTVRRPFGFFVKLTDYPDAIAVVDAISYLPLGEPVNPHDWPEEGQVVDAIVVDHVEHNREVKLEVSNNND